MSRRIAPSILFLALTACIDGQTSAPSTCGAIEPRIQDTPALQPELAFATRDPTTGRVETGTFEEGIVLESTAETAETITLAPFGAPGLEYRIRDPKIALAESVCAPIGGAGGTPNDFVIAGPADAPYGVLVRSGDNAVSAFDLTRGLEAGLAGVRLPETEDGCGVQAANPWFAAPLGGDRVAVTAYGQARTYVLDMKNGAIEETLALAEAIELPEPIQVSRAIDADCDGTREDSISRFTPRTPQAVAKTGDALVVGYTNFYSAEPPIYLPGLLAIWTLSDLSQPPRTILLPAMNPQELRALEDDRILVVLTGVLSQSGAETIATTPGMVLIIDATTGAIEERYELGDFAPGTALLAGGSLWVGSLVKARLAKINPNTNMRTTLELNNEDVDSVFRLLELPGDLIAAPTFDADQLFIVDAKTGELSPPPFYAPIAVGPGRPIFDGLSIVARRPGRAGVDFVGPDLFALSSIASRVTPIELRKVLGP